MRVAPRPVSAGMHRRSNTASLCPQVARIRPHHEEAPSESSSRNFRSRKGPGFPESHRTGVHPEGMGRRADPGGRRARAGRGGLLRRRLRGHDSGKRPAAGLGPVRLRIQPGEPGRQAVSLLRLRGGGPPPPRPPTRTKRCRRRTPSRRRSPRCSSSYRAFAAVTALRKTMGACSIATWTITPPLEAHVSRRSSWPKRCTKTAPVLKKSARRSTSTSSPTSR